MLIFLNPTNQTMTLHKKYRILVADSDLKFQRQLSRILNNVVDDYENATIELITETNVQKINEQVKSKLDLVFLDAAFFINNDDVLLSNLFKNSPNCIIVLLTSDKVGKNIMKVIDTFKRHNQLYFGEHLLKDNYSDDIISFFCRGYVDRIVYH
jgi:DNA-binding NtrC family response regulator